MTIALASLAGILALGYIPVFLIVLRHLKDRDALERDERARDAAERDTAAVRHLAQVSELLQRIQAPQLAVMQHAAETGGPDDTYPMSDEESAEAQERALALERLEEMERRGLENFVS